MRKLQGDEIRKARRQKGWSQQKLAVNAMMLDIDLNDNVEDTDGKHI